MEMNFGQAVEALKAGQKIARSGWNGNNMFLFLNKGSVDIPDGKEFGDGYIEGIRAHLFNRGDKGTATRLPNINLKTAKGSIVTGWLASQTDILAEDWEVAEQTS